MNLQGGSTAAALHHGCIKLDCVDFLGMWRAGLLDDTSKVANEKTSERKKKHPTSKPSKTTKELRPAESKRSARSPINEQTKKHGTRGAKSESRHAASHAKRSGSKKGDRASPLMPMVSPVSPLMMMHRSMSQSMESKQSIFIDETRIRRKSLSSENVVERRDRNLSNLDKIKEIKDRVSKVTQ